MDKFTTCLTHDRTTKNKERFSLLEGEDNPGVASVYIEKAAMGPGGTPRQVVVTVSEATVARA